MKYLFEPEKGKIYDFFAVLNLAARFEKIEELYTEIGIVVHENIANAYSRIYSLIREYDRSIKLFFRVGEKGKSFFSVLFSKELIDINSIQDVLDKFHLFDVSEMSKEILSYYDPKNNFPDSFYAFLVENKQMLMKFLDGLNMPLDVKWDLVNFLNNPKEILDELYDVFKDVAGEIEEEYKINQKFLQDYYTIVKGEFSKNGENIIKGRDEKYEQLIEGDKYTTVCFAVSLFAPYTVQYKGNNRTLNVYLGYEYDKGLHVIEEINTDATEFFKSFTDSTRMQIIQLIKHEELYAAEIGERLESPVSSLSFHLDILCSSGLVSRRNEGKKTYYKLRPEAVQSAIQLLKKITS